MRSLVLMSVAGIAGGVSAGELGDVGLLFQNGELVTALADDVDESFSNIGERVFGSELSFDGTNWVGDDPGFFTNNDTSRPNADGGIAVGSGITYETVAALQVWDGSSFVSTGSQLAQIQGLDTILTPGSDSTVAGYNYTYGGGAFDEHPDYAILGGSGIYLWQIEFLLSDPSGNFLDRSETLFLVFDAGVGDPSFDEALEYAEDVLVPTPGAAAVLGLGGLMATRRRR
ncbi:MAG: hypothetical protein AAF235_03645 [Planctomycetota bacterium]